MSRKPQRGRPKLDTETVVVSVSMPKELHDRIQKWAEKFEMPLAQAIRVLCKNSLESMVAAEMVANARAKLLGCK